MFKKLINEAHLRFVLHTESPLSIRSGESTELDPTAPKMQCMRTRSGEEIDSTVFIPGSSLKGVIRSRTEMIIRVLDGRCCNGGCPEIRKPQANIGEHVYREMCVACRMFGSTSIGSRVRFVDAYPVKGSQVIIGTRKSVAINRITGASQNKAFFDFEVVEEASFDTEIILRDYELYQLKLLLYALKDLNDGYTALGGSTSRGLGRMSVTPFRFVFRDYRLGTTRLKGFLNPSDEAAALDYEDGLFYLEASLEDEKIDTIDNALHLLELDSVDMRLALKEMR